jgi:hypothetical protein
LRFQIKQRGTSWSLRAVEEIVEEIRCFRKRMAGEKSLDDFFAVARALIRDGCKKLKSIKIEFGLFHCSIQQKPNSVSVSDGITQFKKHVGVKARQVGYEALAISDFFGNPADDGAPDGKKALLPFDFDYAIVRNGRDCLFNRFGACWRR